MCFGVLFCAPFRSLYAPLGETLALKVRCSTFGVFMLPAWRDFCTQGAVLLFRSLYFQWQLQGPCPIFGGDCGDPVPLKLQFCDASGD